MQTRKRDATHRGSGLRLCSAISSLKRTKATGRLSNAYISPLQVGYCLASEDSSEMAKPKMCLQRFTFRLGARFIPLMQHAGQPPHGYR